MRTPLPILIATLSLSTAAGELLQRTLLDDYVNHPDNTHTWQIAATKEVEGARLVVVDMVSQHLPHRGGSRSHGMASLAPPVHSGHARERRRLSLHRRRPEHRVGALGCRSPEGRHRQCHRLRGGGTRPGSQPTARLRRRRRAALGGRPGRLQLGAVRDGRRPEKARARRHDQGPPHQLSLPKGSRS